MKTETTPFNPVDYLESEEEIAQYLNDAYQDDDPRMFMIALGNVTKAKGVAQIARKTGLNRESLYKVFSGQSSPQWSTVQSVMKALGCHLTITH
jgi:probable addiction module antidote protein